MNNIPPLGLLLDVDGPIASPVERRIAIDSITRDLVSLANEGIPVVFNTGRTDSFVRDQVIKPLLAAGLSPRARVYGVCEKGAVWFGATAENFSGVHIDESLALDPGLVEGLRGLLQSGYTDTMFWDAGKRAMVSIEQRTDVSSAAFIEARGRLAADAFDLLVSRGLGVVFDDRRSGESVTHRVETSIISVDVESVQLGKDLGARRAIELLRASGALPRVWRTVGDSRTDYAMADHLHSDGFEVAHVDVRPADGVPQKPYPVITEGDLIHDQAGAAFLAGCVREFAGG